MEGTESLGSESHVTLPLDAVMNNLIANERDLFVREDSGWNAAGRSAIELWTGALGVPR